MTLVSTLYWAPLIGRFTFLSQTRISYKGTSQQTGAPPVPPPQQYQQPQGPVGIFDQGARFDDKVKPSIPVSFLLLPLD